jgi:prepilin-type N-terminal cleavage/methylation domain-containing protein
MGVADWWIGTVCIGVVFNGRSVRKALRRPGNRTDLLANANAEVQIMALVRNNRQRRSAFTLMEVLIVMSIIVIIAGLGGVYVFRAFEDAKKSAAQATAYSIASAAQQYNIRFKNYPETLDQLVSPPDGQQPYVDPASLIDPWGGRFQYDPSGQRNNHLKPDVWTTAKDGTVVGNWPLQ